MPTPVATAKQCLTPEAAHALYEAVSVARGRGHAQTTSLHAVSAFLSLPSSPLRDACFRARNAAFCYYSSPRAQIRALDFALSLSLDRSPASQQRVNEPPISNSLMAAIKRSQANQRRQPDSFGLKQEQGKEQLGTSGIKVEIQHLIVAILDDPIVSRLFNEAGFNSFDLKLAMVRPLQGFWRYNNSLAPRQRIHRSMFLCNQEDNPNPSPSIRPFKFPFSGESCGDEDFRRVGEVLVRKQGRNPLLFGVCAYDALQGFVEAVRIQDQFLPLEIRGVTVVSVEREILKFLGENSGEEIMNSRFEELGAMVEGCCGPGLMICFGDLKAFVKDDDLRVDLLSNLVAKFTKFLEVYRDHAWLIGCATYEIYLKFLNKFPSAEKDWDLQLLAITSMKISKGGMNFKSSLMGSFVPFAGFFPSPSDFRGTSRSSYQLPIRGNVCSEKHAQEAVTGSGYNSVADRCQTTLPSWLCMDKTSTTYRSDTLKAKDDGVVLRPITVGCHSNWDDRSQNFHSTQTSPMIKIYEKVAQMSNTEEEKAQIDNKSSNIINTSNKGSNEKSSVATDLVLGVSSHSHSNEKRDLDHTKDFKSLFEALIRRIDCQEEAIRIISQTVSQTRASNGKLKGSRIRGDIWMNFIGSDTFSMRKTALALSEVVCGSKGNLVYFDLNSQDGLIEQIRRKTMVDQIADNLSKTPSCVVFLENLHLAHPPAQNSLLHAVRTSKFLDSHGREVGIGNSIFLLRSALETRASGNNKRKLHCLDLNVPADEFSNETHDPEIFQFQSYSWLEEISSQVDVTVIFKPLCGESC